MPSKKAVHDAIDERLAKSPKKAALWNLLKPGHAVPIVVLFGATKPAKPLPGSKPIDMQKYVGANVSNLNKILALHDLRIAPGDPRASYVLRPLV